MGTIHRAIASSFTKLLKQYPVVTGKLRCNQLDITMKKLTGKCHCGKNTFTIDAKPEFQFVCYCNSCRVINSGGHLCGMFMDQSELSEARDTQTYTYNGGSGKPIILHFCPTCATHLYAYPTARQGKVVIRANTLENSDFKPQQAIFAESAFVWDKPLAVENPT